MPAASTANNLTLSLVASQDKPALAAKGNDNHKALFETSLNQQLQARHNEQMARDSKSVKQTSPSKAPEKIAAPEKPREQRNEVGEQTAEDVAPKIEAPSATHSAEKKSKPDAADKPDAESQDEQDAAALAGSTAAILAQLQAYVDKTIDTGQSETEAIDDVLAKGAEGVDLTKALPADSEGKDAKLHGKALDAIADPSAKIASKWQALPDAGLEINPKQLTASTVPTQFVEVLNQNLQSVDAAAARQQLPVLPMRIEAPRNQSIDQAKSAFAVHLPVGGEGWDRAIGHKVVMMVSNQQQEVEMQLNPAHLGPMDVKLTLNQDQATLTFVAAHAPVREALQASMPRLSEMLAESGIQLMQADVQTKSGQDGRSGDEQSGRRSGRGTGGAGDEPTVAASSWRARIPVALPGNVNLFV